MTPQNKTTPRIRGTTPQIEAEARRLRHNMTPAERALWEALRGKKLDGLKFRAQHPVGSFILDFWCPSRKLVVEVDGNVHQVQEEYDEARTKHLESYGYRVVRFHNDEVLTGLSSVLERISEAAKKLPS
ncbi:MAG: endonuclease domain-containing protein [Chloroflexota bacterium]|nr:endonuclease domain-containing protein [Chloroflexota bacterium]